ncbi:hypothetical protein OROMI_011259 [Orobanche minor]
MASSQTSSISLKKKESIIHGRGFDCFIVMKKIETKADDLNAMKLVVARIKQQGLYRLGNAYHELYDESVVEEFYLDASVHFHTLKRGGDMADITAVIRDVEICINRDLLKNMLRLPSDCLRVKELESFASQYLLTTYWEFTQVTALIKLCTHLSIRRDFVCFLFIFMVSAAESLKIEPMHLKCV